jgi:hypothetical protein
MARLEQHDIIGSVHPVIGIPEIQCGIRISNFKGIRAKMLG